MNASSSDPASTPRSVCKRLFSWRALRWLLAACAVLVTLLFLLFAYENWRGRRAWESYRAELEAKGEKLNHRDFAPPAVPDAQNFAMTPFLAPMFDFEPGTQKWRDTNAVARLQNFAASLDKVENVAFPDALEGVIDKARWKSVRGNLQLQKGLDVPVRFLMQAALQKRLPTNAAAWSQEAAGRGLLRELSEFDPVLEELRSALQRPHSRYNILYDAPDPASILLPHLAVLKRLARLAQTRAAAALAAGRPAEALRDTELILDLANTLRSEPVLISYLVRVAMLHSACQSAWEGLASRQWPEADLARLQAKFEALDLLAELRHTLRGERAFGNGMIVALQTGAARYGQYFDLQQAGSGPGTDPVQFLPHGWWSLERMNYNRLFQDYLLAGPAQPWVDPRAQDRLDQRMTAEFGSPGRAFLDHRLMARLLLPALGKSSAKAAAMQAMCAQGAVACALERHRLATGALPATLDELVPSRLARLPADPVLGGSLRYRREADGQYTLYSLGWDAKDGGGEVGLSAKSVKNAPSSPVVDPAIGDWVWKSRVLPAQ